MFAHSRIWIDSVNQSPCDAPSGGKLVWIIEIMMWDNIDMINTHMISCTSANPGEHQVGMLGNRVA